MTQVLFVGLGAGLAAALLFVAPVGGSMLAFPLFALTGLPVAIAGLGWGVLAAAAAVFTALIAITAFLGSLPAGFVYVALFGAPVMWLVYLAGLSRGETAPGSGKVWYPATRILLHATLAVGIGVVVAGVLTGFDREALVTEASSAFAEIFGTGADGRPLTAADIAPMMRFYVGAMPFVTAFSMTLITVFDLWAAERVVRISGRLARTAPPLWTTALPREVLAGFAAAVVLALALPFPTGDIAKVFAGAFFGGLVLMGLAVLHALTYGGAGRVGVLVAAYVITFVSGLPILLLAIVGGADPFFNFRARRAGGRPSA